jgi:predicted transcriptional regulator
MPERHAFAIQAKVAFFVKRRMIKSAWTGEYGMAASSKHAALRIIQQMPDDSSLEEVIYELYFRQRVERGLEELRQGKTVSHQSVKKSVAKWLRSAGQ